MNYFGQLPVGREGIEYNLVLIDMALVFFMPAPVAIWGSWCGTSIEIPSTPKFDRRWDVSVTIETKFMHRLPRPEP